jgi:putative transposase
MEVLRLMQQIITAKLKLLATPEQYHALRQTQLVYRDALNYVSQYAFEHGKTSSEKQLHRGTYYEIRRQFKLPSEMTNNVIRQVGTIYKGLWTKARQNIAHRENKATRKRFKGLDKASIFISPTVTYNFGYDYGFKSGQQVSIRTLEKRTIIPYQGYKKHIALIQQGATFKAARLWYDKRRKQFYLLVALEISIAEPEPDAQPTIVGVDVGQRYLATTATLTGQQLFFPGKAVRAKADHYTRLQKRLQRKGTRSAIRRLQILSGRERRFKLDVNHVIAKTIIEQHPQAFIGIEDLTNIRERIKRRKHRRKDKKLLQLTTKQRRANQHVSKWAFAELHDMIMYKAALAGSIAIKVDANYTSKACPMCGYIDEKNRPGRGLLFICQNEKCAYQLYSGRPYTLHADPVGARNIAMRAFCIQQDWRQTGQLSVAPGFECGPDASNSELKAAKRSRLERYAELRWSSDASSVQKQRSI